MASRWRIRHKLLLGLGLVVAIMALLLCGTLYGLWSYYLTTNGIRFKLVELIAAEEVKSEVGKLVGVDNAATLIAQPARLEPCVRRVREALVNYRDQLDDTLSNSRDPRNGLFEKEVLDQLTIDLESYQKAVKAHWGGWVGGQGDVQRDIQITSDLKKLRTSLVNNSLDLRDHIKQELADRLSESRRNYQVAIWILVPSSIVGLLIMAGLMRSFTAWIFTPIRDLGKGVSRVADGDLHHRIELHSGDEMEELARAFNDMLARLCELYTNLERQVNERSRQLVRSERLASVGFLAAGVAHEINNPLASIAFCSEALESRLKDLTAHLRHTGRSAEEHEIFSKYLKMIQNEAFRCKHITERLLEFSRTGEPRREPADLRLLVQAVLDVTQHLPNHKSKQIIFEVPPERTAGRITASVNAEEIKSVVLNLVVNAMESMDDSGLLTIRLSQREGLAELRFTDTGCGMTPEVVDNIFEPFFTRSRSGKGTGLGLTISHLIISQHGGQIEASSPGPNQGSTFVVRLPIQARESKPAPMTRNFESDRSSRAA